MVSRLFGGERLSSLISGLTGHHTAPGHRLEELLDLGRTLHELVGPELERRVLDEFDEGDEESPGVGPVHNQPLQQHPGDLLLDGLSVGLAEQVEQEAGEVVGVRVGVSQLVGDTVEEEIPTLGIHIHRQILENVHV